MLWSLEICPLKQKYIFFIHSFFFLASRPKLKGPLRAARLCILSVLLPGVLVAVALYMRYHVYGEAMYPIQASDMRLLDGKMSTTWCQVIFCLIFS